MWVSYPLRFVAHPDNLSVRTDFVWFVRWCLVSSEEYEHPCGHKPEQHHQRRAASAGGPKLHRASQRFILHT